MKPYILIFRFSTFRGSAGGPAAGGGSRPGPGLGALVEEGPLVAGLEGAGVGLVPLEEGDGAEVGELGGGDGEGLGEDAPDDGLRAGRGREGARVAEEGAPPLRVRQELHQGQRRQRRVQARPSSPPTLDHICPEGKGRTAFDAISVRFRPFPFPVVRNRLTQRVHFTQIKKCQALLASQESDLLPE